MKYIPDKLQTHEIKDTTLEVGKLSKKVIHVEAGAPAATDDTGLGYEQGSIWIDSSSGDMYICSDHSAEDAVWQNMEGDDVNVVQFTAGATTGFILGGAPSYDGIESLDFASDGDSTDTSDELTEIREGGSGAKSSTQMFVAGDYSPGVKSQIDAYTIASPHTYSDWGEITVDTTKTLCGSHNNDTYAWTSGGYPAPGDTIQKYVTASAASTTDVGSCITPIRNHLGLTDSIGGFGYTSGGDGPPGQIDEISRFSLTSDGDATDVGNLTASTAVTSGGPSETHGFSTEGGAGSNDDINKFAWGSSGDASDVGEVSRGTNTGKTRPFLHTATHWYQTGGIAPPGGAYADAIDKLSFTAPHALTDVGELVGGGRENQMSAST